MPTDWNQKLAWILRDQANDALDLLALAAQRSSLTGDDEIPEHPLGTWLLQGADRAPAPKKRIIEKMRFDWGEFPEITHPLSSHRTSWPSADLTEAQESVQALFKEAIARFEKDARRTWLWIWRYLPERLAQEPIGQLASQIPADPNLPNFSIWQRMAFDGALASAGDEPTFLRVHLANEDEFWGDADNLRELSVRPQLLSWLVWQAMLPIVEQLGPDAILTPSLQGRPEVDAWLATQGVTAAAKHDQAEKAATSTSLPPNFVALVPSDRVEELGAACKARVLEAWTTLATQARARLESSRWGAKSDKTWAGIWKRQLEQAWNVSWTSVPWRTDTTGAGSLVTKRDITAHEKWARLQEDAAGLDEPWKGIFYGLWYQAGATAAVARERQAPPVWHREPAIRCTCCGGRESLHRKLTNDANHSEQISAYWKKVSSGNKPVPVQPGERLCSVCATLRVLPIIADETNAKGIATPSTIEQLADRNDPIGLAVLRPANMSSLMAGGKDKRGGATISGCLHSRVARHYGKGRSHARDVVESVPPLGPARHASVQEAFRNFSLYAAASVVTDHDGTFLIQRDDLLVIACPAEHLVGLLNDLHTSFATPFLAIGNPERLTLLPGPDAVLSANVIVADSDQLDGNVIRKLLAGLTSPRRKSSRTSSVTMNLLSNGIPTPAWEGDWEQLSSSLGKLIEQIGSQQTADHLIRVLSPIQAAVADPDLGKSAAVRINLIATMIQTAKVQEDMSKATELASAVCEVVDASMRLAPSQQPFFALESLRFAARLVGAAS